MLPVTRKTAVSNTCVTHNYVTTWAENVMTALQATSCNRQASYAHPPLVLLWKSGKFGLVRPLKKKMISEQILHFSSNSLYKYYKFI